MEASYAQKVDGALHNMRLPFRHYPRCSKCPLQKDMSLICLNQDCGQEFFQLICPYCHREEHQHHELRVEDDLDLVLQMIENHTRDRLIKKQVSDQDIEFIDVLLDSQKSLNKLLNKIQQVKFILDDTLAGYRSRMKNFENVIRNINNAQMSSSQAIINDQLKLIKQEIMFNVNQSDIDIEWRFERNYNTQQKMRREGFGKHCFNALESCYKTLNNLFMNFKDISKPILEKRLLQKVCLEGCNERLARMDMPWKWEKYEDIEIQKMNAFQNGRNYRQCIQLSNKLEEINVYSFTGSSMGQKEAQKKEIEDLIKKWERSSELLQYFNAQKAKIESTRGIEDTEEDYQA